MYTETQTVKIKRKTSTHVKYKNLLELATTPGNELLVFQSGTGLITGPKYTQGIWLSHAIIDYWREQGLLD